MPIFVGILISVSRNNFTISPVEQEKGSNNGYFEIHYQDKFHVSRVENDTKVVLVSNW